MFGEQKGKSFECMNCKKEVLVLRTGKNPGPPMCCSKTMTEQRM